MSDIEFPRICDLRPHTVVELPDGNVVRLLDTQVPAMVEVSNQFGRVLPIKATVRVKVRATPEQLAVAFLQSLPDPAGQAEPVEYGIVIPWRGAFRPTDIRGGTPEDVLAKYARHNPVDAPPDPVAPRRTNYVARYGGQHGLQLSLASWQPILIEDGQYRLGDDEGPRVITTSPFELGG